MSGPQSPYLDFGQLPSAEAQSQPTHSAPVLGQTEEGRQRSRSPVAPREAQPGPPLERYRGAQRDNKPAWMTKGLGIGTAILGEATGELMKPGLTKSDLERIEKEGPALGGPDPFGDLFRESKSSSAVGKDEPKQARAPLPAQDDIFAGRYAGSPGVAAQGRGPLPSQDELFGKGSRPQYGAMAFGGMPLPMQQMSSGPPLGKGPALGVQPSYMAKGAPGTIIMGQGGPMMFGKGMLGKGMPGAMLPDMMQGKGW